MPIIDQLLKPTRSLVVTFSSNGTLTIERLVQDAAGNFPARGTLLATTQVLVDSAQFSSINFEFGLDGGDDAKTSALFVEMLGAWEDAPWDCDLVNILGGDEQFPFGSGPLGMSAVQNPARPRVRKKKGVFANTDQDNDAGTIFAKSEITLFGPRKTSLYQLVESARVKVFSLWFPADVTGYVKFSPWPGTGEAKQFVSN